MAILSMIPVKPGNYYVRITYPWVKLQNYFINLKSSLFYFNHLGTCTCGRFGFRADEDEWTRIVGGTVAAANSIPYQVNFC